MPEDNAYVLGQRTYDELQRLIYTRPGGGMGIGPGGGARQEIHVKITGGPGTTGYYDCLPTAWNVSTSSWDEFDSSLAADPNGDGLEIGVRYKATRYGIDPSSGKAVYQTERAGGSSSGASGGDCAECGWLADPLDTTQVLKLSVSAAIGRCHCIPTDQGTGSTDFLLVYDSGAGAWVGMANFHTCCGCGTVTFSPDPDNLTATLTLAINKSCSSGEAYTFNLKKECCRDGSITFVGWGTDNCSGAKSGCTNVFRVRVECAAMTECLTCDCDLCTQCCLSGETTSIWQLSSGGWTGSCSVLNGTFFLQYTSGCTWIFPAAGQSCGGVSITMSVVPDPGGDISKDKIHIVMSSPGGGGTYEIGARSGAFQCCGSNTLSLIGSGMCGAPSTITIKPPACAAHCDPSKICKTPPPSLWVSFGGSLAALGTVQAMQTTPDTFAYSWSMDPDGICNSDGSTGVLFFTISCFGTSTQYIGLGGEGAHATFTSNSVLGTCDPVDLLISGTDGFCGHSEGPWTATVTE
jgi:hypothetical protein